MADGRVSDSQPLPWHPTRLRVPVPALRELVPPFIHLTALKNAEQHRDGTLRYIDTLLRDRAQHGDTDVRELLAITTQARCSSIIEEPDVSLHVAGPPSAGRPDTHTDEPPSLAPPMVVSK